MTNLPTQAATQIAPWNDATIQAVLAAAEEAEIGIAIRFLDDTDLESARTMLYKSGAAQTFQVSVMDNPKEIWLVKKTNELPLS